MSTPDDAPSAPFARNDAGGIAAADDAEAVEANESEHDDGADDARRLLTAAWRRPFADWNWLHLLHLSLLSTVGVTLRSFLGRLFGGDCETAAAGGTIDDWLWPVSHRVCVTANGRTAQHGGALFIDLPANMVGSFLMGFVTGHSTDWPAIPCLRRDHPLQHDTGLHVGVRTAVCGALTTFSSWNTQMVVMMDGTANPYLGSQVIAAMVGYLLGLQVAADSFRSGRTVNAWLMRRKHPDLFSSRQSTSEREAPPPRLTWYAPALSFAIFALLVGLFMAGDFRWGIPYYRELWIACVAAPVGTALRWRLSTLNKRDGRRWFPLGTFLANLVASVLSAGLQAQALVAARRDAVEEGAWAQPTLAAVSLGVAGSLSTVSTFAKECVEHHEKSSQYEKETFLYSLGTLLACCFAGLMVYSPIVRYM